MSTETKNAPAKKNANTAVAETNQPQNGSVLNINQMAGMLEKMKVGDSVVNEYWTPEPGESERVFFVEKTTMLKKNADQVREGESRYNEAVKLLFSDGSIKVNADKVIVSSIINQPIPSAYLIECTGWAESKSGKYREFNINRLS